MTLFTVWLSGLEWPINIEQTIGRMQAVLKKKRVEDFSRMKVFMKVFTCVQKNFSIMY